MSQLIRRELTEDEIWEAFHKGECTCPVCFNHIVEFYDFCSECNWQNDVVQYRHKDWTGCANLMSLNQAREVYKNGEEIH